MAHDLISPRFQIICLNLWKACGSIIPALGLHSQYCWMSSYTPPQPKPGLSFLQLEEEQHRPDDQKWDDEGCSAKTNMWWKPIVTNSLDDISKIWSFFAGKLFHVLWKTQADFWLPGHVWGTSAFWLTGLLVAYRQAKQKRKLKAHGLMKRVTELEFLTWQLTGHVTEPSNCQTKHMFWSTCKNACKL